MVRFALSIRSGRSPFAPTITELIYWKVYRYLIIIIIIVIIVIDNSNNTNI